MQINNKIWSLNPSSNVLFGIIFGDNREEGNRLLTETFETTVSELHCKGVEYSELRSALLPPTDFKHIETALVFDTEKIADPGYGPQILGIVMPLLKDQKDGDTSILCGDIIVRKEEEHRSFCKETFFGSLVKKRETDYWMLNQYYVVYLSRQTEKQLSYLSDQLMDYAPYIGYMDLTANSIMKSFLSHCLIPLAIKHKRTIIQILEGCDDDFYCFDYCYSDYKIVKATSEGCAPFLSYKIHSLILTGKDTLLLDMWLPANDLDYDELVMGECRWNTYLNSNESKKGLMKLIGCDELDAKTVQQLLIKLVKNGGIFDVRTNDQREMIFTVIADVQKQDITPIKIKIVLKYDIATNLLCVETITR